MACSRFPYSPRHRSLFLASLLDSLLMLEQCQTCSLHLHFPQKSTCLVLSPPFKLTQCHLAKHLTTSFTIAAWLHPPRMPHLSSLQYFFPIALLTYCIILYFVCLPHQSMNSMRPGFVLFSAVLSLHLEQCLALSRHSVNIG